MWDGRSFTAAIGGTEGLCLRGTSGCVPPNQVGVGMWIHQPAVRCPASARWGPCAWAGVSVLGCSERPLTARRGSDLPPPWYPPAAASPPSPSPFPTAGISSAPFPPLPVTQPRRGTGEPSDSTGSRAGSSWWYRNRSRSGGDPLVPPLGIVPNSLPAPGRAGASRCHRWCWSHVTSLWSPCSQQVLVFFFPN